MYDLTSKHKEYIIDDKRIIWFWDEDNHNVKELKVNNLCGFVKNKEFFSEYDCDENLIYKKE